MGIVVKVYQVEREFGYAAASGTDIALVSNRSRRGRPTAAEVPDANKDPNDLHRP